MSARTANAVASLVEERIKDRIDDTLNELLTDAVLEELTQEAINNAIKTLKGDEIIVSIVRDGMKRALENVDYGDIFTDYIDYSQLGYVMNDFILDTLRDGLKAKK